MDQADGRARRLATAAGTADSEPLVLRFAEIGRDALTQVGGKGANLGELAAAGRVDAAEDVFFLDLAEARRALDGADSRALVRQRRNDHESEMGRGHVPRVLLSDGTVPERHLVPTGTSGDGGIIGTPASSGVVTANARVVLDPADSRLQPGEILVAPSTDPGWTPLFLTAAGLVMEMGGPTSHGAVVAREYGIPAVVGVHDATGTITSGQRITLDGSSGKVTLQPDGDGAHGAS